jgi:iron complex outermembrane receptor protein
VSYGQFIFDYKHTIQLTKETQLFADSDPIEYISRTGFPKHVGNLNATLRMDDWRFTWNAQIIGKTDPKKFLTKPTVTYRGVEYDMVSRTPTAIYHSISASVDMMENLDVTFGFANLFDKAPPKVTTGVTSYRQGTSVMQSQYDPLGRRFFVNLTYSF